VRDAHTKHGHHLSDVQLATQCQSTVSLSSLPRCHFLTSFLHSRPHTFKQGTVGAGLPVIGTLKHLVETGDKVEKVEGVFSGTLSYIFNSFGAGRPFSEVVADAKANGYTEPDPRDDLNGTDVARKVCLISLSQEQG